MTNTHRPDTTRIYDDWARVYDWNPAMCLVAPARKRAIDSMNLEPGDTVVDMGTGTGANLPLLRDAVGPTGTVLGVDASRNMLARARERTRDWKNVTLIDADIRDPPLRGPVDGICSSFVVSMFDRPDELVSTWTTLVEDGAITTLYAAPSTRWYGRLVTPALDAYCRLFETGWGDGFEKRPSDTLATRSNRARTALTDHATETAHGDALLGILAWDTGYVD